MVSQYTIYGIFTRPHLGKEKIKGHPLKIKYRHFMPGFRARTFLTVESNPPAYYANLVR